MPPAGRTDMKAVRLKTEYLSNPMGIDIARPKLFWNCEDGVRQTAYEITAADDCGNVRRHSGKAVARTRCRGCVKTADI